MALGGGAEGGKGGGGGGGARADSIYLSYLAHMYFCIIDLCLNG